jgi:transcriptional regulator with XRE-family HTH domain
VSGPEIAPNERAGTHAAMSGIGETLRRAREQRGISRDDLARSLRLERRILICLENDELDQLAAPAFVRGYVRSLCKELAIDSAPLLEYLDGRFGGAVPALADFSSRAPAQITGQSDIVRYTTAIVALVMVVLMVLWWQSHEQAAPLIDQSEIDKPLVVPADTPPLAYESIPMIHFTAQKRNRSLAPLRKPKQFPPRQRLLRPVSKR